MRTPVNRIVRYTTGVCFAAALMAAGSASAAQLIIETVAEDAIASPGNSQPLYIIASVRVAGGAPVLGLTAANFAVSTILVGPGGALSTVQSVSTIGAPGNYLINLVPFQAGITWQHGTYVFGVAVQRNANVDRGQTLASVLMD